MSEKEYLKKFIREILDEEEELDESTATGAVDGYETPHAFSSKKHSQRRKKTATQAGYTIVGDNVENITESVNEGERVYIDYLNKDKRHQRDRKYFTSYDAAVKWARKNFEKFSHDMIHYESVNELTKNKPAVTFSIPKNKWNDRVQQDANRQNLSINVNKTGNTVYVDVWGNDTDIKKVKGILMMWVGSSPNAWVQESVNEGRKSRPVNRWLELKNDDTKPNKKLAVGLKELKYKLREIEKFLTWYNKISKMNELSSDSYWKRTHRHIYKIKERLVNIAHTIKELEK